MMKHDTLTDALAAAQGAMPAVPKDRVAKIGPGREYRYADLATVLAAVRPVLSAHGLALMQRTTISDGALVLVTEIRHGSGEVIDSHYPVAPLGGRHQDMGGALTYARRYALCSLLGIAADEDDDGATAAETPQVQLKPAKPAKPAPISLKERGQKAIEALDTATPDKLPALLDRAEALWSQLIDEGMASSAALLKQAMQDAEARA